MNLGMVSECTEDQSLSPNGAGFLKKIEVNFSENSVCFVATKLETEIQAVLGCIAKH